MDAKEAHEVAHETAHHGNSNRKIALLISILAAFLAICEMGAKSSQNTYTAKNIEAANLWSFFQAKTIRGTAINTAAELLETEIALMNLSPAQKEISDKRITKWKDTVARYQSEPETGEGRKELAARAKEAEATRDKALSAYHNFEFGSAAFQLAIVLTSASMITGIALMAGVGVALGAVGTALMGLGFFAPTLLHL